MQTSSFNLVQTTALLQKQWKTILFFVLVTVAAATVTVFLVPQYFKSSAIMLLVLAFNLLGNGLRDALNVRGKI